MSTSSLLFTANDSSGFEQLYATDGSSVTQLTNSASTPLFAQDPIFNTISAIGAGADIYLIMADASGATSAIWSYDGKVATQLSSSSQAVYNQPDYNASANAEPLTSYNGAIIFSQESATDAQNGVGHYLLSSLDPTSGQITQIAAPNGGYNPQDFTTLNGVLYYEALDSSTNSEAIYAYNGSSVTEVYNLHPTYYNSVYGMDITAAGAVQGPLVAFNNHLYFGSGQESVYELTALTSLSNAASNITGAVGYDYGETPATNLFVNGAYLYFVNANNGVYSIDASNNLTSLVGSLGAQSFTPVSNNGTLYFTSLDPGSFSFKTYTSNGASASVSSSSLYLNAPMSYNGQIYYNNSSTDTLGVTDGSTIGALNLPASSTGNAAPLVVANFSAAFADLSWSGATPCFCAGTRLATPEGEIAVEQIEPGVMLLTAEGQSRAVRWVGRSEISLRFADPLRVLPIRIRAGALGAGLPRRDLLVSPDHALFLDGVLAQAGALVNGVTILRERDLPGVFTYYHVELARHELLLAEGAPTESFVDNIDRMNFGNWAERAAPDDGAPIAELPFPRLKSARQIPRALRERLAPAVSGKPEAA